jgi:RTX calcium-binding nonapeptide repeat (4 copies)
VPPGVRWLAIPVLLIAAPPATAATVSGVRTDDFLEVTYLAAPRERNEVRVIPHETGIRFAGSAPLVAGEHCFAVNDNDVRCGPPGPEGLIVHTRTGGGDDVVFARVAHVALEEVALGRGDDVGRGNGLVRAGPGDDDVRVVAGGALFHGGPGEDVLAGGRFRDLVSGGPGPDLLVGGRRSDEMVGGRGRDQLAGGFGPDVFFAGPGDDLIRAADAKGDRIDCGPGRDVAHVAPRDTTKGCERIVLGWPG